MPDSEPYVLDPEALSKEDRRQLRKHLSALETLLDRGDPVSLRLADEDAGIELSAPIARVIGRLLTDVAQGRAVTVAPADDELTTQEAADLLNVSRPHLVKLLKDGKIPHHRVGSHRRVRRRDVLAYKETRREQAEEALQDLADQAQELGLGYR